MDIDRHIAKAEEALQRKNPDYAIGLCRQILGIDLSNAKARACLRKASLIKKKSKGPAFVRNTLNLPSLVQLQMMRKLKKYEAVLKACDRVLVQDPYNAKVGILAGESALALGFDDAAIEIFEGLGSEAGGDPQALKALGSLYRQKGEIAKALDCYEAVLKLDPKDNEAQRARKNLAAEEALKTKGFETATSSRQLLKNKEETQALERQARIARTPAEIQTAIDELEEDGAGSGDPGRREQLAELYTKKEDYGKALELLEPIQESRPDDQELKTRIGDLTILEMNQEIGNLRGSADNSANDRLKRLVGQRDRFMVDEYGRRVALYPTDLGLRHRYGTALMKCGQIDEAIAELQKAVNDPKNRLKTLAALGNCFALKKMHDLAAKQFLLALESSSGSDRTTLDLRYRLGQIFEEQGELQKARDEYSKILEKDINFRDVSAKVDSLRKRVESSSE